eukprot:2497149-Pleurochrysis_carterae.AAC.2
MVHFQEKLCRSKCKQLVKNQIGRDATQVRMHRVVGFAAHRCLRPAEALKTHDFCVTTRTVTSLATTPEFVNSAWRCASIAFENEQDGSEAARRVCE